MSGKSQKRPSVDSAQLARREDIFRVYRDMGPARSYDRLLVAVEKKHGDVSKRTLANWSRQHSWQERIAEHDREIDKEVQRQSEPLDPNFDKVDALLRAAHLTMMRVLQACPVVKTARDAKAMLDAAVTAMKLAEMLRPNQRTPEENEESRRRMWALIDKLEDAKRAQFEAEGKTVPAAERSSLRDDTASPD